MNPVTARERKKGGGMSGMAEVQKHIYIKEEAYASAASRGNNEDKGTRRQNEQRIEGHRSSRWKAMEQVDGRSTRRTHVYIDIKMTA